ncbi:MAG: cell division protein SepF [Tissierellia bacterium]|nr:cell division protein SepF [Tissierellia bacterium]
MFEKLKGFVGVDDNYEYDDYEDETVEREEPKRNTYETYSTKEENNSETYSSDDFKSTRSRRNNNIVNMNNSQKSNRFKISIQEPLDYNDAPKVIDDIRALKVVVLNLEMVETDKKRQIFDFVSGGVYALDGRMQKVTKGIFVICPKGVDIDGSMADQIQSGGMYQL